MASTDAQAMPRRAVTGDSGRVPFFDNLKYVLIVLVVVGHYIDPFASLFPAYGPLFFWIYLFHMPLFVLTTGLGAQRLLQADGGFRIARVGQFLLLYLVLYAGIYGLEVLAGKEVSFTPWSVANASWYLLAAALWYLLTPALAKVRTAVLLPCLVLVALAVGYFPAVGDLFSLSRVICFAPFFFLGLRLRREQVTAFLQRAHRWRLPAAALLLASLAVVYAVPVLLRVRGILTARNTYAVLNSYAAWGAGFRLVWYAGAVVLGACVLLLVPRGRSWITTAGTRTLQVYIWHLWGLRGLALIAFVPLVRQWADVTPLAAAVPLLTALVAAHLFLLRPPFGVVSDWLLGVGRRLVLPARAALAVSLLAAVALPAAAFATHPGPLVIDLPRGLTPWVRPTPTPRPPPPPSPTVSATPVPAGRFELPLVGAVGFATVPTTLAEADGYPGGDLRPGQPFVIRRDEGSTWVVEAGRAGGRLTAAEQLVNLPDLVPSIVYSATNAEASRFRSSGVALPGITGERLYDAHGFNARLEREAPFLPVAYPTAARLQQAQRAALAAGDTLIVFETFRPAEVQQQAARALFDAYAADDRVRAGIGDWGPGAFLSPYLSDHQLGVAVDVSLGRVVDSENLPGRDGDHTRTTAEEYPMPSAVHELSRAAAALAHPVRDPDGTRWQEVPTAATMTPAALELRGYLVDAGLVPAAAAWWEFHDLEARRSVPAGNAGRFRLTVPDG